MSDQTCMYCNKGDELTQTMVPIGAVDGYPLYLMRNQTYRGRVVLAYHEHIGKIGEMPPAKCAEFFLAVRKTARALTVVFQPGQINIGMYADKMSHLHCHITPKYENGPDWGGIFQMNPQPPVLMTEREYQQLGHQIMDALKQCEVG